MHPETAVDSATASPISQNGEEFVLVDGVLTLAESLRGTLIGGTKTIIRLAAQTNETFAAPLNFE